MDHKDIFYLFPTKHNGICVLSMGADCYCKYFIYDIGFGYSIVGKPFVYFILPKGYGVNLNPGGARVSIPES